MRYLGGKHRISEFIVTNIDKIRTTEDTYLEPFVGSAAILSKMANKFDKVIASDIHEDLILMYKELQKGWVPPKWVSREEYNKLKHLQPSALRGIVGFGSSFGGKWFGGYTDTVFDKHHNRDTKPYMNAAVNSLLKIVSDIQSVEFIHCDYTHHKPKSNWLVYCDPPYNGTTSYNSYFNSDKFWENMNIWVDSGATIIISEQIAPSDWTIVAEKSRRHMLKVERGTQQANRLERIYTKIKRTPHAKSKTSKRQ